METITYSPLNLFTNFQEAAAGFSETPIICDQPLSAFPELGLETTYKKCFESVLDRAYQLAHLGVKSGDKVIIYKSSAFDTYLLAVSVSYLGAVPVMTSYHLPTATMEVFYLMMRQKNEWEKFQTGLSQNRFLFFIYWSNLLFLFPNRF